MNHIKTFEEFNESITLPIEKGDVLLGGRWRNKKTIVKRIGRDENGQVTVNGKPILKFRIEKTIPKK